MGDEGLELQHVEFAAWLQHSDPGYRQAGDRPMAGSVMIAPGDRHLEFDDRGAVALRDGPHVNGCRPAAPICLCQGEGQEIV